MRYSYSKIGGMAMIEKVGVYCRLSDEDRFKANKNDDSDSIINQRSMCLKYANQNIYLRNIFWTQSYQKKYK